MKKQTGYFLVLLAAAIAFHSCKNSSDYKKTQSGLLYKIFSDSKDSALKEGSILKINYTIKIGSTDSVLNTTYGKMPQYAKVETAIPPNAYSPIEVFGMLHKGDSLAVVQFIDSLVKKNPGGALPPFLKKGDKIVMGFKIISVFKSQEEATADRTAEVEKEKARLEKETEDELVGQKKDMETWLAKNNITAQKTGKGTYVVVKDPGTGMQADSGKYATVRFSGRILSTGKEFQSTMDPKSQPYAFMVGVGESMRGWDEGIKLFKSGGKGTLYIPGALAYGKNPRPGSPFKPNDALIFDIDVVAVSDTQPAPPQQEIPQQLREQLERQQQQQQKKPNH
jgi:FKBP-type peptidyl-prolyl cis-trans isomerase FkpA